MVVLTSIKSALPLDQQQGFDHQSLADNLADTAIKHLIGLASGRVTAPPVSVSPNFIKSKN